MSTTGVHSHAFRDLSPDDQEVIRARATSPEPMLTVIAPRPSVFTVAMLSVTSGRLSHLQAELAAFAVTLDAAVALSMASRSLLEICATYGLEVHEIKHD